MKMKMGSKLRGYVLAALAMAACIGTWAAVVHADQRLGESVGFNRERAWLTPYVLDRATAKWLR